MKSNRILHSIYVNERESQLIIAQQQQYNDTNNNWKVYNDYYCQHYRYHYNGVINLHYGTFVCFFTLFDHISLLRWNLENMNQSLLSSSYWQRSLSSRNLFSWWWWWLRWCSNGSEDSCRKLTLLLIFNITFFVFRYDDDSFGESFVVFVCCWLLRYRGYH